MMYQEPNKFHNEVKEVGKPQRKSLEHKYFIHLLSGENKLKDINIFYISGSTETNQAFGCFSHQEEILGTNFWKTNRNRKNLKI